MSAVTARNRQEWDNLMLEKMSRHRRDKMRQVHSMFYPFQTKFNAATLTHSACLLMAANQVGKTRTGTLIDAVHLTGLYDDDWAGYRFDHPITCWLLGYSGEKTRDLLQNKIFGRLDTSTGLFAGGLIPHELIVKMSNGRHDYKAMSGTSGAVREVRVKHASGGISTCQIWSYSQGQHALMGDVVDWYHIDEEPEDSEIYPQVITRTLNGDKGQGGRGILTFTPENGRTELVVGFMDTPSKSMYLQTATWDEAPHLSKEVKEAILSQYPEHQRGMRSRGEPLMGAGLIFDVSEESISIEPFKIPEYWYVINGMDFGWDHPQAHIQMVWDRDADTYYIVNAWKESKKQPFEAWHIVKPWAEGVPTAWPADGLQTEKGSAKQQKSYYEEEGFSMLAEHATWEGGGTGVWAGIMELNNLMKQGRLKIFSNLFELFAEIRQYHTKRVNSVSAGDTGRVTIAKISDDLLDSSRYAYMMRRHAIRICDLTPEDYIDEQTHKQESYDGN